MSDPQVPEAAAIEAERVANNLYVLRGGGRTIRVGGVDLPTAGTTAAFITTNGVVLVDTKLPGWGKQIIDKLKPRTAESVVRIHRSSFIVHRSSFIVHRSSFISHRSSFIVHRSSFIVHRSSFIIHRSSFIVHHSSFIVHRSSFIVHRSSFIVHRSSVIVHRSTFIVHRSSFIVHRSSFIVHRSSFIVHQSSFSKFQPQSVIRQVHSLWQRPVHHFVIDVVRQTDEPGLFRANSIVTETSRRFMYFETMNDER